MFQFKFEGGAEMARMLEKLPRRISRDIQRRALKTAAEPMRQRMAENAPHEPGKPDLRDSMTISNARGEDEQVVSVAVGPSRQGYYGSFQEFGTAHHAAQPFARPAFDETVRESLDIINDELWWALKHGNDGF